MLFDGIRECPHTRQPRELGLQVCVRKLRSSDQTEEETLRFGRRHQSISQSSTYNRQRSVVCQVQPRGESCHVQTGEPTWSRSLMGALETTDQVSIRA